MFLNKAFGDIKVAKTNDEIIVILAKLYDDAFRYGYQDGYHKRNVLRYLE